MSERSSALNQHHVMDADEFAALCVNAARQVQLVGENGGVLRSAAGWLFVFHAALRLQVEMRAFACAGDATARRLLNEAERREGLR